MQFFLSSVMLLERVKGPVRKQVDFFDGNKTLIAKIAT